MVLKERIFKDVQATQNSALLLPLPDILYMRPDQYVLLQDDPDMQNMFASEDRVYATPLNAMEVRIQTEGLTLDQKYNPVNDNAL